MPNLSNNASTATAGVAALVGVYGIYTMYKNKQVATAKKEAEDLKAAEKSARVEAAQTAATEGVTFMQKRVEAFG